MKKLIAVVGVLLVAAAAVAYHLQLMRLPFDQAWPSDARAIRTADVAYWRTQATTVDHFGVATDGAYALAIYNGGFSDQVVLYRRAGGAWTRVKETEPDACSMERAGVPAANARALDYKINHMVFFGHGGPCEGSWYI